METSVRLVFAALGDVVRLVRGDSFGYELSAGLAAFNLMLLVVMALGLAYEVFVARPERQRKRDLRDRLDAITNDVGERRAEASLRP